MARPQGDLPDWPFGASRAKRRLIARVVSDPEAEWTQASLAKALGLNPKGSVDEHLAALTELGVLERRGTTYHLRSSSAVTDALKQLLEALAPFEGVAFRRPP